MYGEEWFLGSLLMPQRFYAKTKEVFKILVRVSFTVPTISSQMWETLVRNKDDSGEAEGMQWKTFSILVCVLLNRKIIASYKDMFPNMLDTRKGSKKRGFDNVSLANACALWLYPTLVPLEVKFIAKSNSHVSTERFLAVEASVDAKGKYTSSCFTGEESDLGVFMSIPSLSSSARILFM
ncbi:hypothetical protein V6N12_055644 [Hibiscus sabdariffa]|uniref:Uncharacterized protein n=2 Tax=Hibiscus sabdariffa TaxID=183260 RepID=A0ABR2A7I3_9ROSI